jgi:hypothetical protein
MIFLLPRTPLPTSAGRPRSPATNPTGSAAHAGMGIIHVNSLRSQLRNADFDDLPVLAELLALDQNQIEIKELIDGENAVNKIEECRAGISLAPNIILLDLHLPKIRGLQVLKAIRESCAAQETVTSRPWWNATRVSLRP